MMEEKGNPDHEAQQNIATSSVETTVDQNARRFSDPTDKMTLQQRDWTNKSESESYVPHIRSSNFNCESVAVATMDRRSEFNKPIPYNMELSYGSVSQRNTMDKEICNTIHRPLSYSYHVTNQPRLHSDTSDRQLNNNCSINRHNVPINCHNFPVSHNDAINRHSVQIDAINRQSNESRHSDENDIINRQLDENASSTIYKRVDQLDTNSKHVRQCDESKNSMESDDSNRSLYQSDSNTKYEKWYHAINSSMDGCDVDTCLSDKVYITNARSSLSRATTHYESSETSRLTEGKPTKCDLSVKPYENTDTEISGKKIDVTDKVDKQSLTCSLTPDQLKAKDQSLNHPHSYTTFHGSSVTKENQNLTGHEGVLSSPSPNCQVFHDKRLLVDQSTQTNSSGDIITLNALSRHDTGVQASVVHFDTETQTTKSERNIRNFSREERKLGVGNTAMKRQSELKKRRLYKRKHHRKIQLKRDHVGIEDVEASPAKRTRNHLNRSVKIATLQVLPEPELEDDSDKDDLEDKNCSDYVPDAEEKDIQKPKSCIKPDSVEKIALRQKKPFKCPFCHKRFIKDTSLENHTLNSCTKNRRGTDFICSECGDHFSLFSIYRKHLKSHVGEFYKCVCGEKFENYLSLKGHIETELKTNEGSKHDEVHPYSCNICLKTFIHQGRFKRHMITHENNSKIACSVCGKEFEKGYMEIHERVHTGHKPFVCQHPDCTMSYTSKKLLQRHERIHVKKYQLPCPHCDKVFTQASRLKDHLRVHTGEKPYICEICGFAFSRTNHLNRHKLLHVKQQAVPQMMVPNVHLHDFNKLNPACR